MSNSGCQAPHDPHQQPGQSTSRLPHGWQHVMVGYQNKTLTCREGNHQLGNKTCCHANVTPAAVVQCMPKDRRMQCGLSLPTGDKCRVTLHYNVSHSLCHLYRHVCMCVCACDVCLKGHTSLVLVGMVCHPNSSGWLCLGLTAVCLLGCVQGLHLDPNELPRTTPHTAVPGECHT